MKKELFIGLFAIIICFFLVGCTKEEEKDIVKGAFTMVCTTKEETLGGVKTQNVVTYVFNEEQLATEYTVVTTQKFEKKSIYNTYKSSQKETIKNNQEKNVIFDLKTDDKNLEIVFSMTLKELYKNAKTEEEKDGLKASKVFHSNEENGTSCELKGITLEELK